MRREANAWTHGFEKSNIPNAESLLKGDGYLANVARARQALRKEGCEGTMEDGDTKEKLKERRGKVR